MQCLKHWKMTFHWILRILQRIAEGSIRKAISLLKKVIVKYTDKARSWSRWHKQEIIRELLLWQRTIMHAELSEVLREIEKKKTECCFCSMKLKIRIIWSTHSFGRGCGSEDYDYSQTKSCSDHATVEKTIRGCVYESRACFQFGTNDGRPQKRNCGFMVWRWNRATLWWSTVERETLS